jgi:hypothetical protein
MLTPANSYLVNWSYLCGVMDVVHLCGVSMTRGIGQLNILIRINAVIANHARSDAVAQLRDLTRSIAVRRSGEAFSSPKRCDHCCVNWNISIFITFFTCIYIYTFIY